MLEEIEEGIITRRYLTSGLKYSYITGERLKGRIQGTYTEESIDSSKQNACWWEVDLTSSR
jgi:hypothetical protein